jgi:hypothetical protein
MIDPRTEPLAAYLEKPARRRLERVVRTYQDHVWTVAPRVAGNEPGRGEPLPSPASLRSS